MRNEFARKGIHIASLSIPICYYFVTRKLALEILVPMLLFSISVDVGRHYIGWLNRLVNRIFHSMLRAHERDESRILLSGATYVLLSATLSVFIFPKIIAITAFAVLIVADAASALFGRMYGTHPFLDKSAEGTIAFVISAWIVVVICPKAGPDWSEYLIGGVAALLGAIVEAGSVRLRFDDNLSVPATVGFTMWGIYYLLDMIAPAHFHDLFAKLMGS
jgi:dolichol kinase